MMKLISRKRCKLKWQKFNNQHNKIKKNKIMKNKKKKNKVKMMEKKMEKV